MVLAARLLCGYSTSPTAATITGGAIGEEELYVLEKVKAGIFSAFPLKSWVKEEDLVVASRNWNLEEHTGLPIPFADNTVNDKCWLESAKLSTGLDCPNVDELTPNDVMLVFKQGEGASTGGGIAITTTSTLELASLYEAVRGETPEARPRGMANHSNVPYISNRYVFQILRCPEASWPR